MTKHLPLLFIILLTTACTSQKNKTTDQISQYNPNKPEVVQVDPINHKEIIQSDFQTILDTSLLNGAILIYDSKVDVFYSNDFEWANKGELPASTFKIPHSIIALETGVVESASTILKWDGQPKAFPVWEQDLSLHKAFQYSCVPCYQQIARSIGADRMNEKLAVMGFGEMTVSPENIDLFWLQGDSKITAFEQIDFLRRFQQSEFPISPRTDKIVKSIMVLKETPTDTLRGKTGWAIRGDNNSAWFVGYLTTKDNVLFFATHVQPKERFDMSNFTKARKNVTTRALELLNTNK